MADRISPLQDKAMSCRADLGGRQLVSLVASVVIRSSALVRKVGATGKKLICQTSGCPVVNDAATYSIS